MLPESTIPVSGVLCKYSGVGCEQGKLRDMERQMEWVRAERDELAAASQGAASDLAARLKDSEQAVTRLKVPFPRPCAFTSLLDLLAIFLMSKGCDRGYITKSEVASVKLCGTFQWQ